MMSLILQCRLNPSAEQCRLGLVEQVSDDNFICFQEKLNTTEVWMQEMAFYTAKLSSLQIILTNRSFNPPPPKKKNERKN